jgi:hypothetical protein
MIIECTRDLPEGFSPLAPIDPSDPLTNSPVQLNGHKVKFDA